MRIFEIGLCIRLLRGNYEVFKILHYKTEVLVTMKRAFIFSRTKFMLS